MNAKENGILERLAVSSLEKCLAKLSKVYAGAWQITDTRVSKGTLDEAVRQHDFKNPAAAAVYCNVQGEFPFTSMMFFDPNDMEYISKCFMGCSFPAARGLLQFKEEMLLELGNILLNSLFNSVLNALKRSVMPSVPKYIAGDFHHIVEVLGTGIDATQNFRIITATLTIKRDKRSIKSEMFAMIPDELAIEMARM
ncbi:MAG: hypothetical protein NTX59_05020 [Elusimicrobia bacterium]|nr:hypothetical protein [Elusimicrobiota bacterium]